MSNTDFVYFMGASYAVSMDAPIIKYVFMSCKGSALRLDFDLHVATTDATDYIEFSADQPIMYPQAMKLKIHDPSPQCRNIVRCGANITGLGIQFADLSLVDIGTRTL